MKERPPAILAVARWLSFAEAGRVSGLTRAELCVLRDERQVTTSSPNRHVTLFDRESLLEYMEDEAEGASVSRWAAPHLDDGA